MSTVTEFDIKKFDSKINFTIWKVQMTVVLTHNGLQKALAGKAKRPISTIAEQWEELNEKALLAFSCV